MQICADANADRASFSTSPAGMRCTAAARSCGSSSRKSARRTCRALRVLEFDDHAGPGTKSVACAEAVKRLAKDRTALGGPVRREGRQGRALARRGLDPHCLAGVITCWSAAAT